MMILDQFKLDGKVAIVTGASRGLGQAMAVALAQAGADIALVARGSLDDTQAQIDALGRGTAIIQADLENGTCVETIIESTRAQLGEIDILVNNAGLQHRQPVLDFPIEQWDRVMQVHLRVVFQLSQAVARVFDEQGSGGKIINIASMLSFQGGILIPAYAAAKTAIVGLTRALATELAPKNINVNAIAPGYFTTELTQPIQDDPKRNPDILARIPAGRWGRPEELGGAVVFLASPASDYMHGYTLAVDGGWLAR